MVIGITAESKSASLSAVVSSDIPMRLVSVNVGLPRLISWGGATFKTGIFKTPVDGRIALHRDNLDGDGQADLSVHGGVHKAVYAYPSEHYEYWRNQLPGETLPWGAFGENFTTQGMLEVQIRPGDEYRIGSAILRVTTPRLPCFKLAAKFRRDDMIERFLISGFSGFYFSVVEEGEVGAGDDATLLGRDESNATISDVNCAYVSPAPEEKVLRRVAETGALPESWRQRFLAKLVDHAKTRAI